MSSQNGQNKNDGMQIAITGAGIGGLAAGLACQQARIGFELFDGAESPLEDSIALTLWANALHLEHPFLISARNALIKYAVKPLALL